LSFLIDTSYCIEQTKKQVAKSNEVKEEEAVTGNSSTDSVNSGSGPEYQIYLPLAWPLGEGYV
jgi:hypothetical protein